MSCQPTPRFEAILAPHDNWMVFDLAYGWPAVMDGHILIGLDRQTAFHLEQRLNRVMYRTKIPDHLAVNDRAR
ncbi:hypothetical protein GCM10010862_23530 [Devosia nitrariae]|uniref:Uncharacterized protein n=1 Tax=Devosia nitrariae TaxID=2071872 RepID=A0ABQ5W5M2_9HYPH|nr:hypothetical protein GCM10010862_23530 [Devosia nitrariae]